MVNSWRPLPHRGRASQQRHTDVYTHVFEKQKVGEGWHTKQRDEMSQGNRLDQIGHGLGGQRKQEGCHCRCYDRKLLAAFKLGG